MIVVSVGGGGPADGPCGAGDECDCEVPSATRRGPVIVASSAARTGCGKGERLRDAYYIARAIGAES